MFSGMRKQILSLVFRKNIVKSIFMQIWAKTTGYRSETATNIVLADRFFSVLIMIGWFPYGDIWADVELSSLWFFFVKHEIQNGCHKITEFIFIMPKMLFIYFIIYIPK